MCFNTTGASGGGGPEDPEAAAAPPPPPPPPAGSWLTSVQAQGCWALGGSVGSTPGVQLALQPAHAEVFMKQRCCGFLQQREAQQFVPNSAQPARASAAAGAAAGAAALETTCAEESD